MPISQGESTGASFDSPRVPGGVAGSSEPLVERARALERIVRQHAETTERQRRLARPVLDAMREAGLFRMFTPRSLGGLEADR